MNIEKIHQTILDELEKGHRGLQRYTSQELIELDRLLKEALEKSDWTTMETVLCLIEHSAALHGKFEPTLLKVLNSPIPDHILVFSLTCSARHIIDAHFQKGQRLEYDFLETLKKHLFHPNPEVVEWTLRLIESSGGQGIYFLREFDKIKPPPWKWFNAHNRAVREIITLLERRWSPIEKSKSRSE